jgi:hypothetical protein
MQSQAKKFGGAEISRIDEWQGLGLKGPGGEAWGPAWKMPVADGHQGHTKEKGKCPGMLVLGQAWHSSHTGKDYPRLI